MISKLQTTQGRYDGGKELAIFTNISLINHVMEENLFVNVEYTPVKHAASRFSVRKNVIKKRDKERTDISGPGPVRFFLSRSSMYCII